MPDPLILLIDDEAPMRRFLRAALGNQPYRFIEASSAREGLAQVAGQNPDVILLDLGLPDRDGLDVTRDIRSWSRIPIIVISARGQEMDKVGALDAGADDYLTKPFSVGELLARIRVAIRHRELGGAVPPVYEAAGLRVDLARRVVERDGAAIHLTPTEYKLLAFLVKHAGRVLTHKQLLLEIWGSHSTQQAPALRVHVTQLRHKIEADPARPRLLTTEPGVGYRLRDRAPD